MSAQLTSRQLHDWHENGYLVLPLAFDASEVSNMRKEADFILELIINSSLCNERQSRRLDIRKRANGGLVVRKIQPINDLSLTLARVSSDDRLIGALRQLMDDEPVLMEEKLNYKQPIREIGDFRVPLDDDRFPVHNDWAYYLYNGYPDSIISSAVTVDDCTEENGSIAVFPGTHHEHIDHIRVRNGLEVENGTVDHQSKVIVEVPAGSIVLFHAKLVHTSMPNQTDAPRRIMIYSHYPQVADMGIDIRNGPNRLRESPWEWEYRRKRDAGLWQDTFSLDT